MDIDQRIAQAMQHIEDMIASYAWPDTWTVVRADMADLDADSRTDEVTCLADLEVQVITYYVNSDYNFSKISQVRLDEISRDEALMAIGEAYLTQRERAVN